MGAGKKRMQRERANEEWRKEGREGGGRKDSRILSEKKIKE